MSAVFGFALVGDPSDIAVGIVSWEGLRRAEDRRDALARIIARVVCRGGTPSEGFVEDYLDAQDRVSGFYLTFRELRAGLSAERDAELFGAAA